MSRPHLEVADIISEHGQTFLEVWGDRISSAKKRVLYLLAACRTALLGGHVEQCDHCAHERPAYNSCRNRHCPKCQATARAAWLEAQEADLLPVPYFHVVFTVPAAIAKIALQNKKAVYNILFETSAKTLKEIAADSQHLGAEIGFLSVLHTWGQKLQHHPHIHCVVPGGGLAPDGKEWVPCRPKFFLPVKVLGALFRGKFLARLRNAHSAGELSFQGELSDLSSPAAFARFLEPTYDTDWVVYSKPPFGGPKQVLRYLARYTHRVAISNHRLIRMKDGKVTFAWKDYDQGNRCRTTTLDAVEFLRRFLLHVLPKHFVRIRHYGFLANRARQSKLARCREILGVPELAEETATQEGEEAQEDKRAVCPNCGVGRMRTSRLLRPAPAIALGYHNEPALCDTS